MKRRLFHGSVFVVEKPIFGYGNPHNDYGLGFYCTEDLKLAKEWACQHGKAGYANEYEIDLAGLNVIDLTDKNKYGALNWIAILLHYRTHSSSYKKEYSEELTFIDDNYYIDLTSYDVVIGYRADDAYFAFPKAFVDNQISIKKLQEIYNYGNLDKQIVLLSKKAFNALKFIRAIETSKEDYLSFKRRIDSASDKYYETLKEERKSVDKRLRDLMYGDSRND